MHLLGVVGQEILVSLHNLLGLVLYLLELIVRERNVSVLVGLLRRAVLVDDLTWLLIFWI